MGSMMGSWEWDKKMAEIFLPPSFSHGKSVSCSRLFFDPATFYVELHVSP
jgi:hypothetical protein